MQAAAVIPVRNRPQLVREAIASVQAQTAPLDEIVVIDDGSTDDTPGVVSDLSRADPRIRLVVLPQRAGASAARNIGVAVSRCEWISFLDSDDQWLPDKHQYQVAALRESAAIAGFTGTIYRTGAVNPPATLDLAALRRGNCLGGSSIATVKRTAFEAVGGFDATLPSCQDWDLWLRLRQFGDFSLIQRPLVVYDSSSPVRISRDRRSVIDGHKVVFERALRGVSSRSEKQEISSAHQIRMAQIHLWDFAEPVAAVSAACRSLMLHRSQAGAQLLGAALRASVRRVGSGAVRGLRSVIGRGEVFE